MNKLPAPIIDKRFHAHMMRLEPMHADDPDFLAMVAFASELCGDYLTTEVRAERALRVEPRNPWAQHALAHVLIRQGRVPEGRARMEAFMPLLATCGRPINSHDAWPLAIRYLEELDVAATLRVFRDHIYCATRCGNVHAIHERALRLCIDACWP
jgi:hypothetical protein